MAIVFASPLFTLLFEWAFFARPKGIVIKVISALVLISGVVLVIQPPFLKLDKKVRLQLLMVLTFKTFVQD